MSGSTGQDRTPLSSLRVVRRECGVCGVHTVATVCVTVSGCCHNCGSYELRPVCAATSDR